MYSYSLANIHDFIGSNLMMEKENAGAATFCPRRHRNLWPAGKETAQKHAERCIGQRNALHQPSQHAAHAVAAHCVSDATPEPLSPHRAKAARPAPSKAGHRSRQPAAPQTLRPPNTTVRSQKEHSTPCLPESLAASGIRPQETEKSTPSCPETLKSIKRSWERLKKKPYLCSP